MITQRITGNNPYVHTDTLKKLEECGWRESVSLYRMPSNKCRKDKRNGKSLLFITTVII